MSLLFNMLSRLLLLPRSKRLLILRLQSQLVMILEPPKMESVTISTVSPSICREVEVDGKWQFTNWHIVSPGWLPQGSLLLCLLSRVWSTFQKYCGGGKIFLDLLMFSVSEIFFLIYINNIVFILGAQYNGDSHVELVVKNPPASSRDIRHTGSIPR